MIVGNRLRLRSGRRRDGRQRQSARPAHRQHPRRTYAFAVVVGNFLFADEHKLRDRLPYLLLLAVTERIVLVLDGSPTLVLRLDQPVLHVIGQRVVAVEGQVMVVVVGVAHPEPLRAAGARIAIICVRRVIADHPRRWRHVLEGVVVHTDRLPLMIVEPAVAERYATAARKRLGQRLQIVSRVILTV